MGDLLGVRLEDPLGVRSEDALGRMPRGMLRLMSRPERDREPIEPSEPAEFEREQTELAGEEAGAIGGRVSSEPPAVDEDSPDEAHRPLVEAGEGESEGFEEAERELIEHAGHGDEHAAGRILQDASAESDDDRAQDAGEADFERSSERDAQD